MNQLVVYAMEHKKEILTRLSNKVSQHDAEDVYQNTLEKLLKYDPDTSGLGQAEQARYVYRCVQNCLVDYKKDKGLVMDPEDDILEEVQLTFRQLFQEQLKECRDPVEAMLESEIQDIIPKMISDSGIPEKSKEVLYRLIVENEAPLDVALDAGMSYGSVRMILHRFTSGVIKNYENSRSRH